MSRITNFNYVSVRVESRRGLARLRRDTRLLTANRFPRSLIVFLTTSPTCFELPNVPKQKRSTKLVFPDFGEPRTTTFSAISAIAQCFANPYTVTAEKTENSVQQCANAVSARDIR